MHPIPVATRASALARVNPRAAARWSASPTVSPAIRSAAAALLVALTPRLRELAWLPVGWALVVGLLGEALRLPRWSRDVSPFELVGRVPVESLDRTAWAWLGTAALVVGATSLVRFRTRSLACG